MWSDCIESAVHTAGAGGISPFHAQAVAISSRHLGREMWSDNFIIHRIYTLIAADTTTIRARIFTNVLLNNAQEVTQRTQHNVDH